MLSIKMKIKSPCFSFIYLLVALAVHAANASPSDHYKYLIESENTYKEGDYYKSDYLIAKYLGYEYADQFKAIETITKRIPKATSYIDGSYSEKFLRFFFGLSFNQWGSKISDKQNNILVKINSNKGQYVSVWGKPNIETWYILHKDKKKQIAYTVGMHEAKIRIGPMSKEDKPLKPCDIFTIKEPIQYFYEPMFLDTNDDGKNELLLRYNITLPNGYLQVLDIFVPIIKDNYCQLSHRKSFYGRNGYAYYTDGSVFVSEQTRDVGEGTLRSSLQTETSYDPYGKKIHKEVVSNFLKTNGISILYPNYLLNYKDPEKIFYAFYMTCKTGKPRNTENCKEIADLKGPYSDEEFCKDRVVEMMKDFHKIKDTSLWEITDYLCKKKTTQELAEKWD